MFMEITGRDDIGGDLIAPTASRSGTTTGSYSLVPLVRPGDVIAHYDSHAAAIVGASVAIAPPEPRAHFWGPRGKSARLAGVQAEWRSGVAVPLSGFRRLANPITRDEL